MTDTTGSIVSKLQQTKLPLWVSLVLAVAVLIVFAWQQVVMRQAEARLEAERTQMAQKFEADRATLVSEANLFLANQGESQSRRFGQALSWAVRGELIRNNLEQVDQFTNELVKVPGIELVVFADAKGKILVASDRKHQGADFGQLYPVDLLQAPEVSLRQDANGQLLVVPVMGLNSRLGTLVLRQQPATFQPR